MKSYGEDIQSSIIRMLKAHQNFSGDMVDLESCLTFRSSMAAYMWLIVEQLEQKAGIHRPRADLLHAISGSLP